MPSGYVGNATDDNALAIPPPSSFDERSNLCRPPAPPPMLRIRAYSWTALYWRVVPCGRRHIMMLPLLLLVIGLCCSPPCTAFVVIAPPCRLVTTTPLPQSLFPKHFPKRTPSILRSRIELADLLYDSTSTAFDAWEWSANLGAPAALVAGAVLVTLSETRLQFVPKKKDSIWIRRGKMACRFLLLSSFALEVVSIFVSTVTGTVLLSHGEVLKAKAAVGYTSPLGLLHHHHEFEYLTIRIGFLQGLLNWLCALCLEILIPEEKEGETARRMNHFMASLLLTIMTWIIAFYNHHLSFYGGYGGMLVRYIQLFAQRYFDFRKQHFRPMSLLYAPLLAVSAFLGWRAVRAPPDQDPED